MKPPVVSLALAVLLLLPLPRTARGHCDTLDGSVVKDARLALDSRNVTAVLKWVRADREDEIREAFQRTLAVRTQSPEARTLADRFFFETLVRVHREGEGAPYTGLKPAGTAIDPGIAASDKALEKGSVDPLVRLLVAEVEKSLRERFLHAAESRKHAGETVEKGREYVAAYVEFMHYAERLLQDATSVAGHSEHGAVESTPKAPPHKH